jgi:ribonuclease R
VTPRLPTAAQIEALLTSPGNAPGLTGREIADALRVPPALRSRLRQALRDWVVEGRLVALRGRRFGARSALGDVVGRYSRHPAGFGFVVPDDPEQSDLFIPPGANAGAIHGDIVAARVVAVKPDGRREGTIARVVERRSETIVGLFHGTASGGGIVQPLDPGFGFEVLVAKADAKGARTGEIVRAELVTPPRDGSGARGTVLERLGRPDEPGVETEVLVRKYGFSAEYPDEVLAEVERLPARPEDWPLAGREDFTRGTVVTIDGETARDFDDAIEVERLDDGGYRLHVHIADVGFFVPEGSATDLEALRRGTSVYFPDRCIPMLPERLSNDLCSLRPDEIRLTQGVSLDFDRRGVVKRARFHDGFIRSRARLTYNEVAKLVEERDPAARAARPAVVPMLDAAAELAALLAQRRAERGAIDFDLPEPEILIELTGATAEIVARRRNAAHRLIEEFMITANAAVAAELKKRKAPALYRVHERPALDRVERLVDALDGLGYRLPGDASAIEPAAFAGLVEQAKGKPEEPFVTRLVLRTMALARYHEECLGHFGLALPRYLHFTSPIRRYPDLVVHRALRRLARGPAESPGEKEDRIARLPELARECSRLEREAEAAEREAVAWKVAAFMADRLGDEFDGAVIEIAPHGVLVALNEPFVEGMIPVARLGPEYWKYDPRHRILRGSESGKVYRLGMPVRVRVDRVDLYRHLIDFSPVETEPAAAPGRARPPGRRERRERGITTRRTDGGRSGRRGGKRRR